MTLIHSPADDATFYRAALLLGLVPLDTVAGWAERALDAEPAPSAELIDLVMAPRELSALRAALQPLALPAEPPHVVDRLLAIVADDFRAERRDLAGTVAVFAQMRRMVALEPDVARALDDLEDGYRLALAGVEGSVDASRARAAEWLGAYGGSRRGAVSEP